MTPHHDYVLVQLVVEETTTSAGIILPGGGVGSDKLRKAKVIASGPGRHTLTGDLVPCQVREGMDVLVMHDALLPVGSALEHGALVREEAVVARF